MFFSNQFADRNFAAEKFLAFSHLVGGLAMLGLRFHPDLLAVLLPDVCALPALRAHDFHHQLHRFRQHEGCRRKNSA